MMCWTASDEHPVGHRRQPGGGQRPGAFGLSIDDDGGYGPELHADRRGSLRKHRHRIYRHDPVQQQRPPGRGRDGLALDYTFTTGAGKDNGVHTFSATLKTAGTQSITAVDTLTHSITGTASGIAVSPAAASQVVFGQQPTDATAGPAIGPAVTVDVEDAYRTT